MIAVPIAGLTAAATLIRTSVPTLEEHVSGWMGSAELSVTMEVDAPKLQAELPAGTQVVVVRQTNWTQVVEGSVVFASIFEPSVPIDRAPIPGIYQMMSGRAPTRAGEAAVDPRVLELYRVRVGSRLTVGPRTFEIVGVAARPNQMWDPLIVVAPGTLRRDPGDTEGPFTNSVLIDLPPRADVEAARSIVAEHVLRRASSKEDPAVLRSSILESGINTRLQTAAQFLNDAPVLTAVSFAGTIGVLFGTGLIAAAAFAVGIRRQLRMLGLVGATGGEPGHVRSVVLFGGTSTGMVGSIFGGLAGVGVAYAATPHLHRITHRLPGEVALHWPTIAGALLLGVLAATTAASWPARISARISTLDALASRMPPPRPPGRLARRGIIAVAAGAGCVATGVVAGNATILTAGLVVMTAGFLLSIPFLVGVAARLGPRMPTGPRIALRETARHGRRTGAAIAAAAIALTMPVAVSAITLSEEAYQRRTPWMGRDHLLVSSLAGGNTTGAGGAGLLDRIRAILPGASVPAVRIAFVDLERYPPSGAYAEVKEHQAWIEGPASTPELSAGTPVARGASGTLFVGGPDLLRALHAEDGIPALRAGKVVGIGPSSVSGGSVNLMLLHEQRAPVRLPAFQAGGIRYSLDQIPGYVVAPEALGTLGLVAGPAPEATLVAAPRPLSPEQVRAVKNAAAGFPGAYVGSLDDFVPDFAAERQAATAAAALLGLAIVAVIVALVSSEARRDAAVLVAVGAAPRTRRRIAASRAGLVTLLAALIALPTGFTPIAVIQASRPGGFPIVVPWATMALVALAVPVAGALFGGLTSRSPKASSLVNPVL